MTLRSRLAFLLGFFAVACWSITLRAQETKPSIEVDGSDIQRELDERRQKIEKLSLEEREMLRRAHQKAADDPEVQSAIAKRNAAAFEFRMAVQRAMLRIDPSLEPILMKMAQTGMPPQP